jgi:hypothetical protein
MLPDTGERYLSKALFADVPADTSEEELKISRSTPSALSSKRSRSWRNRTTSAHAPSRQLLVKNATWKEGPLLAQSSRRTRVGRYARFG